MHNELISAMRQDLKNQADEKTRDGAYHYFKENISLYGVKTAAVTQVGRRYFRDIKDLSKKEIFSLCEELFKSDYMEEAFIASEWTYNIRNKYEPEDFLIFEKWVSMYINNWAKCDTLCNHALGAFIVKYPQYMDSLKRWTLSANRWLRRAAAVTLVLPARQGQFIEDILQIADALLEDREDLVQKGYGWMLKEASRKHQSDIFDYVMKNKKVMPRTALRYAIEKMPDELRRQAMKKEL